MRALRIIEHITLDGIIQAPGGRNEDGPFEHGGWVKAHMDPVVGQAIQRAHGDAFDLVLGRRTYDIWAGYWPTAKPSANADSINRATKFVATHRPETLAWGPAQGLGADIVAGVRRAKSMPGPDLVLWGSSTITPLLLASGLADQIVLITYPVIIGTGKRFFANAAPQEFKLVSSQAGSAGVVVNTFTPAGPMRTGDLA
ncbi:MAG: dihydrofolate reductase family protein [Phycisphaerales bacterium]